VTASVPVAQPEISIGASFPFPFLSFCFFVLSLPASSFLPLPSLSRALPFSSPSFPLKVGPPKIQLGDLGSAVSSPCGVWGGALAEIEFGAF